VIKKAKEVFEKFSSPWIVKSYTSDANQGVFLAKTFSELVNAIDNVMAHGKSILIEEFIDGKIASVHSVPNFRNEDIYTFPFCNTFGIFTSSEKEKLIDIAKNLHTSMEIKHYLKSDFILDKRGKVYLLNFDLIPELRQDSHFSQVCASVGTKMHYIIEHIFDNTLM
jgi:D-alanine-D-alanine ligase-like ATP-grasp enzyme